MIRKTLRGFLVLHRMSWNGYSRFLFFSLCLLFACSSAFAAEKSESVVKMLVSKSNAAATAVKNKITKSATPVSGDKNALTSGVATKTPEVQEKKKGFQLPDRDADLEKVATTARSVEGVVTGVSKHGVAVEYAADPEKGGMEIWFNYTKKIKLSGIKKLDELQEGDTVSVAYKEAPDKRKLVDGIKLVAKKPKEAPVVATTLPTAVALTAKESL